MILKVENISRSFGKHKVLRNISFEMDTSVMYGIVGENGSGKSTLLKIIAGEWKADQGMVSVAGRIGYCPQKSLLFSQLTVEEHFRYFASAYRIENPMWVARSEMLMDYFNFRQYKKERISNLSGGTQQKLNLSLALLHQPDLLILDEPYNGFDWDTYMKFRAYADQLKSQGTAILMVTHLITEKEWFDKVYDLFNGHLV